MTAKILQLRCAVSYLYEQKAWWDTNFYDPDSKAFLSYIFPKSNNSQPSAAFDVFRHLIDKEVGSAYYHLFRLPVSMEEKMFQNLDYLSNFEFNSVNGALDFLSNTANGLTVIPDSGTGPKNIGSVDKLNENILAVIAAEYYSAFTHNYKVHPYLLA